MQQLTETLASRARHGLDHMALDVDPAAAMNPGEREVGYTKAALRYAMALATGSVDPASLHQVYTLARPKADIAAGLAQAVKSGDVTGWLDTLAPQDGEYRQLSEAYLRYSQDAAKVDGANIAKSGLIKVGSADPRVAAIAMQLRDGGYLAPAPQVGNASPIYDRSMAEAVKQLQRDYGIADDAVIGLETLTVLNLGSGERARQIAVALERRRWLDRSPDPTRIDVNVAAARLRYYRDGAVADSRKVIVGQPGNETPALLSPIYRLVANPTWTVPKSIQNGEMAGIDQAYLDSHNMVMQDGWIVQQPGPDNALGLVKFDMANQHAIYLHDTSSPNLFERSKRQLSHGCVRVEDALGFAQMLAKDAGVAEAWQAARDSGEQTFVPLSKRIPVRMLYHNVFVDDSGSLAFRADPYGWNDAVAQAIGFKGAAGKRATTEDIDIAP